MLASLANGGVAVHWQASCSECGVTSTFVLPLLRIMYRAPFQMAMQYLAVAAVLQAFQPVDLQSSGTAFIARWGT